MILMIPGYSLVCLAGIPLGAYMRELVCIWHSISFAITHHQCFYRERHTLHAALVHNYAGRDLDYPYALRKDSRKVTERMVYHIWVYLRS